MENAKVRELKKCPNCGLETDNELIVKYHSCEGVKTNKLLSEHEIGQENVRILIGQEE